MSHRIHRSTEHQLDTLVASALAAGTPEVVAQDARSITARRFSAAVERTRVDAARMEAYFWGVVRRRALSGQAPAIARIMIAASLASELREAGHTPEAVARALT